MSGKVRLSASVDRDVVHAGQRIVGAGRASSFSAWVNAALIRAVEHDRRLEALAEFVTTFEGEHGVITDSEMLAAGRATRERSTTVRSGAL